MVLTPGDPAPWFTVRSATRPDFQFATMAGRYAVISFIGSAAGPAAPALLEGPAETGTLAGFVTLVSEEDARRRL